MYTLALIAAVFIAGFGVALNDTGYFDRQDGTQQSVSD